MKANNIKEAEKFFLNNSDGKIVCIKGDIEKEVDCYPDAVDFFEEDLKDDR